MHKQELIDKLNRFIAKNSDPQKRITRGQIATAKFLARYLEKLNIPQDTEYDFWSIEPYLCKIAIDAFEELRTGTDEETIRFREEYEADVHHSVPNLTDLGSCSMVDQTLSASCLGQLLDDMTEREGIRFELQEYCFAQLHVVKQVFRRFIREVYGQGMFQLIEKCSRKGMGGKFGEVELRTYVIAGRILFTFAKRIDKSKKGHYVENDELYCNEWYVTYVAESDDPLCLSAGIQSIAGDMQSSVELIEEVIKNWPKGPKAQKKIFHADNKVCMI